ncbi:MAG: response regulator [Candidatus Sulfotelmatobacter sp.]
MRILIAEDDAALAGFVRQGLVGEHYAVDVVEDGEQARAMGSEFDYDLVILDLNLPKLDGVSVLRHLRLKRPSLPVLVLTQRSRVEDRVQCLDTGADDYSRPQEGNSWSASCSSYPLISRTRVFGYKRVNSEASSRPLMPGMMTSASRRSGARRPRYANASPASAAITSL